MIPKEEHKDTFKTALPDYFTAQEVSLVLGYKDGSYISRLCRDNKIKAYKLGTYWLIPYEQAKILIENKKSS